MRLDQSMYTGIIGNTDHTLDFIQNSVCIVSYKRVGGIKGNTGNYW